MVADEEPGDVDGVEDRDLELRGAIDERPLDLEAGVVAGERRAAEGVRTEEALRDPPVVLPGEAHAVAFEVLDAASGALGHDLHRDRVGEQVALLERVGRVLLPGVLGIDGRERGIDAAGGERRMGVRLGRLPTASTSDPRSASSIAARSPEPPVPMTRTDVEICCSFFVVALMYSTLRTAL